MPEEIQEISSFKEATDYVVQRYKFIPENYPKLEGLNPSEVQIFAIKHSLFHMQKTLRNIVEAKDKLSAGDPAGKELQEKAVAKMFINCLLLIHLLKGDMSVEWWDENFPIGAPGNRLTLPIGPAIDDIISAMGDIAEECENYDHEGVYKTPVVTNAAIIILHRTLRFSANFRKFIHLLERIPEVMKSK